MALILSARRSRQPAGPVKVAGDLARGIVFAGIPSASAAQLIDCSGNGLHGDPLNAPGRNSSAYGVGSVHTSASSQRFDLGNSSALNGQGALSILFYWQAGAGTDAWSLFTRDDPAGRAYTLDAQNTAGQRQRFYIGGSGTLLDGADRLAGEVLLTIATFDNAAAYASLWVNGILKDSASGYPNSPAASTTNTIVGGRTYSGFEDYMSGSMFLAVFWNRCLPAAECVSLSANPWQIFAPIRRRMYFDAAAAADFFLGQACL